MWAEYFDSGKQASLENKGCLWWRRGGEGRIERGEREIIKIVCPS
jgi:hypothetical protein